MRGSNMSIILRKIRKCFLTNEAKFAGLGEKNFGAAKGMKDFIMTLWERAGSGIIVKGEVFYLFLLKIYHILNYSLLIKFFIFIIIYKYIKLNIKIIKNKDIKE